MRPAPLLGLVSLLALACNPDPSPARALAEDDAQPAPVHAPATSLPSASSTPGEQTAQPTIPRYDLCLEDAGLPELVRAVSAITGKRFVLTGALPTVKASVCPPERVTAEEAYHAFLTILASNGLTVVPRGRMLVIVPSPGMR
ncbi:MAG: hypothetical protein U0359_38920 [Byssovorax sp.]